MKKLTDKLVPALALIFAAAITVCVLTAATPSNIPISGMNITTQAVEGAYFPLIQPWPGRSTNDNWRIAKSNLFSGVSVSYVTNLTVYSNLYVNTNIVINTNITINSNVVTTFADTLWTNDAAGLRPADHITYNWIAVSNMHTYGWEGRDPEYVLVTTGSNTLDTTAFSSLLIFSEETNAASAIISLSPGLFNGQELELYNYTNSFWAGQFTLPANSQVLPFGGGYVKLRNNMDWATTNGSGLTLRYIAPDWIEMDRSYFGTTNQPQEIIINPTDGRLPYRVDADEFGDSPLYIVSTNIGLNGQLILGPGNTNVIYRNVSDLYYTNGADYVYYRAASGDGSTARFGAGGNLAVVGGVTAVSLLGGAADLRWTSGGILAPVGSSARDLGYELFGGGFYPWRNLLLSGTNLVYGFNDGVTGTNYSRLATYHTGTNGAIVFDSQANGTAGSPRPFWMGNTTNHVVIPYDDYNVELRSGFKDTSDSWAGGAYIGFNRANTFTSGNSSTYDSYWTLHILDDNTDYFNLAGYKDQVEMFCSTSLEGVNPMSINGGSGYGAGIWAWSANGGSDGHTQNSPALITYGRAWNPLASAEQTSGFGWWSEISQTASVPQADHWLTYSANGSITNVFGVTHGGQVVIPISKTPASSSETNYVGAIAWDSSYIYVWTATNVNKRAALSTW